LILKVLKYAPHMRSANVFNDEARLSAVVGLCHDLAHATTLDGMFQSVVEALVAGTGLSRVSVLTFDDAGVMRFRAAHGLSREYQQAVEGHSPWSIGTRDPVAILVDDAMNHESTASLRDVLAAEGIGGLAFLPLCGDGLLLGKFMLYSEGVIRWDEVDLAFAGAAADLLASFLMRAQALDRLRQAQKMESLGLLAGGIAHDFNNLLTSILGHVDLLRTETLRGTPAQEHADRLREIVEQAADMTRQLLGFARPHGVPSELVNLCDLLNDALPGFQNLCGPSHQLRVDCGDTTAVVAASRAQLHQLLLNLVTNARDAMPDGGSLVFAVRPGRRDGLVSLWVTDTGVGMDDATRARIFEPLFTTKMLGRGTGLGLATCYAIVTRLGGEIAVRSAPGRGSEFVITLPLAPIDLSQVVAQATASAPSGPTVLLVDDQAYVLEPIVRSFERAGYQALTANNGRVALEVLQRHAVDVIVSDVIMPEMDGVELVEHVLARWPSIPVMFITGYVDDARDLPKGVPVLLKPFNPRELIFQVDRLLSAARTRPSTV